MVTSREESSREGQTCLQQEGSDALQGRGQRGGQEGGHLLRLPEALRRSRFE